MSQGFRDMLANRRFAIPLIALLAFCFIGLILVGIVLILRPGLQDNGESVAGATATSALGSQEQEAPTVQPTSSPTPRPSPTLVPVGTEVGSGAAETPEPSVGQGATATAAAATAEAIIQATSTAGAAQEPTATPPSDEELADTGIGWGLILISGVGLAALVIVARRLRLAQ
jgi:hypothetical protein